MFLLLLFVKQTHRGNNIYSNSWTEGKAKNFLMFAVALCELLLLFLFLLLLWLLLLLLSLLLLADLIFAHKPSQLHITRIWAVGEFVIIVCVCIVVDVLRIVIGVVIVAVLILLTLPVLTLSN